MLNIKVGNNVSRNEYFIDENSTVREALEQAEINYSGQMVVLDGSPVRAGTLDCTFASLGYDGTPGHDKGYLSVIAKVDNA